MARITLTDLSRLYREGSKITMLTAYDASFARVFDAAGVESILVGDSLGMVVQGHDSTLAVTLEEIAYHVRCVVRGSQHALIIGDLPFGSYQESLAQAFRSAAHLMAAGAHMVKPEGGAPMAETVRFLVERGIPVCGHIGLVPQSVHALGGFRVQGRDEQGARRLVADARALEDAGASLIVLEAMPAAVGREITQSISIPTIGIGAGADCSGQVLVLHDLLGVSARRPKFARNFLEGAAGISEAAANYVAAVKSGAFPAAEHCY